MKAQFEVAINVGGTFIDVLCLDEGGTLKATKLEANPNNQVADVVGSLYKIAQEHYRISLQEFLGNTKSIVIGTTIANKSLLDFTGADTAMINTQGFTDILEQRRVPKESSNWKMPKPTILIPRHLRFGVRERVRSTGEIIIQLDEDSAREAVRKAKSKKVYSIAVCLLHSYIQPKHEIRLAEIIREEYPEAEVILSSDALPRIGEFDRASTTAITAYITPTVTTFLNSLQKSLTENGYKDQLLVATGNGGVETTQAAIERAGTIIGSAQSGGPLASVFLARINDIQNILLIDIGGTSYDISIIPKQVIPVKTHSLIGDQVSAFETVKVITIGSGGGSIAWLDKSNKIQIGPDSAGTVPGPACYSKGGKKPTVTDADVVLGYIPSDSFIGDKIKLDAELAHKAIEKEIAKPLGITTTEAAYLIRVTADLAIANQSFIRCIEQGSDPREFTLLVGGGIGPVHGFDIAKYLNIQNVYIPKAAPTLCALGILNADYKHDFIQVLYKMENELDLDQINEMYMRMEANGIKILESEGILQKDIDIIKSADICYYGQATDVSACLPIMPPGVSFTRENLQTLIENFHNNHDEVRGFSDKNLPILIINLKLTAIGKRRRVNLREIPVGNQDPSQAFKCEKEVFEKSLRDFQKLPCYYGDKLLSGNIIHGPALIEEWATTVVVPSDAQIEVDKYGNYIGKYINGGK